MWTEEFPAPEQSSATVVKLFVKEIEMEFE
jgi:hypothetical protein